jgi:hypothetical protein
MSLPECAWPGVAGGIRAGVFALAQRGPDAPTAGPALSGAVSAQLTPTQASQRSPAARNLLALPSQLRECDPGRIQVIATPARELRRGGR